MELRNHFCSNLKRLYHIHQQTLTAFADELGISRSSLQEMLKGNSNPRLDTIEHMAKNLGCNPLVLLLPPGSEKQAEVENTLMQLSLLPDGLSKQQKQKMKPHVSAIIQILLEEQEE